MDSNKQVDLVSDSLHRALLEDDAACVLVIDPSTRAWDAASELRDLLEDAGVEPHRPSASPHRDLDASYLPLMYELDPARASGSVALRASIAHAFSEFVGVRQGHGRSICLWLTLPRAREPEQLEPSSLVALLSSHTVQRRPNGGLSLVRWYDPAVLCLLWPQLSSEQRGAVLLTGSCAHLLDPDGGLVRLVAAPSSGALRFDARQWVDLELISAINVALQDLAAVPETRARSGLAALPALRRAYAQGLTDKADLAAFATHAITVAPDFDCHPTIRSRLDARAPGDHYTALIDDLTSDEWQAIAAA